MYFSLNCFVTWYYQQFGLDSCSRFSSCNLQLIFPCPGCRSVTRRMENLSVGDLEIREVRPSPQFSPGDISTYVGLTGLLAGSLSLLLLLLWLARTKKSLQETQRRSEPSCQISGLVPPPPYTSLDHGQAPPPSYQWAMGVKQSQEDDSWSSH